jgi:translation initiation factor 2B subunit (eIF-2B alpha/beta/delta family)
VDTRAPELEVVPAALTTAILTEYGPVPPSAIWDLGRKAFGVEGAGR